MQFSNGKKTKYKMDKQKGFTRTNAPKSKKQNNIKIKAPVLIACGVFIIALIVALANFRIAQSITVNGEYVGTISNVANLDLIINEIKTTTSTATDGDELQIDTKATSIIVNKTDLTSTFDIRQNILALCPNVEKAYAIYVNEGLVCATRTETEAFDALDSVKKQYNTGTLLEIDFLDSVVTRNEYVAQNQIANGEEAKNILNGNTRHREVYELTNEEELANIAQRFAMSITELQEMNKNLGETVESGAKVNILKTQSNIRVQTKNIEEYTKEIGYGTDEVNDNKLPLGSRVLASAGKPGVSTEKSTVIRINGQEQDRIPISESITTQPTNEIMKIGTLNNGEKPIFSTTAFIWPNNATVTSPFNPNRLHPIYGYVRPHEGLDIGASYGASVRAAASGKVTLAQYSGDYGNCIRIKSDDTYSELYAHLSKILVKEGQQVTQGQEIGKVGNTGASTGAHLHFEIRKNNMPINPITMLPKK